MTGNTDLEEKVGQFSVHREHGQDLGRTMARTLFSGPEQCVLELVANSYDADAERVLITYEAQQHSLTIQDIGGTGMDRNEIAAFFRMGDSPKKVQPISPKGRRRIGKHGIASLAVRTLADRFTLDSYCAGAHYHAEEVFGEVDQDNKEIAVVVSPNRNTQQGVTLNLSSLKCSKDHSLSVGRLKKMLATEMPISIDGSFEVYLNRELITPLELGKSVWEYLIDMDDPRVGKVSGKLFYSKTLSAENVGIFTKVNGLAVGGDNAENFDFNSAFLQRRIYGVINVDGMESEIRFDRTAFVSGAKRQRLYVIVNDVLKQIRNDTDKIENVPESLGAAFLERIVPELGAKAARALKRKEPVQIVFSPEDSGGVVHLDRDKGVLNINPHAPAFTLGGYQLPEVRQVLYRAVELALAESFIPNPADQERLELFASTINETIHYYKQKRKSLADLLPKNSETGDKPDLIKRVSPARLYTMTETARLTGLSNAVLKRIQASGVITERGDKVLGADVSQLRATFSDKISLFDAAREATVPEGVVDYAWYQNREETAINALERWAENHSLPNYIANLASPDKPSFYTVTKRALSKLVQFLESNEFSDRVMRQNRIYGYTAAGLRTSNKQLIFFAAELEAKPETDVGIVRASLDEELSFIKETDQSAEIYWESYFGSFADKFYAVGAVAVGRGLKVVDFSPLKTGFEQAHYAESSLLLEWADQISVKLLNKRAQHSPLVKVQEFPDSYRSMLSGLVK